VILTTENYRLRKYGKNGKQAYIPLSARIRDKIGNQDKTIIIAIFDEGELEIPGTFQDTIQKLKKLLELQNQVEKMKGEVLK